MNYNGWANKSTWLTALNINNDEYLYNSIKNAFNKRVNWQEPSDLGNLAFITRNLVEEYKSDFIDSINFDLVNWNEISWCVAEISENELALRLCENQKLITDMEF